MNDEKLPQSTFLNLGQFNFTPFVNQLSLGVFHAISKLSAPI
jgi:hypothetical protein